ncbi:MULTISPECIES: hypothetical protein [Sphingobacterium]|uniref:hypothetical protein n=1 Tax=Sphingobacterium TaxID=28453 RepID=UPI0013DB69F7|nr:MULTISPECIES: hypothetical protein [unclassified Sphingobacterium]
MRLSLLLLGSVGLLFASCLKNDTDGPEIIVEPPFPAEVILDSIQTGSLYNVTVGASAEEVYKGLQGGTDSKGKMNYLGITGVLNTKLSDLKDRIPLYNGLILDQRPSNPLSAQIYFKDGKIESIYYRNSPNKLSRWPADARVPLKVGDPLESIYGKLVGLEKDNRYTRFFEYIGLFEKNIDKPFDTFQNKSNLWQFSITVDDKNFIRVDLVFENAVLVKIRSRHERYL